MTDAESFERGFITTACLLGRRSGLAEGLAEPQAATHEAARRLTDGDRAARAQTLAGELEPIAAALLTRGLT
jgi:hypothetical protein